MGVLRKGTGEAAQRHSGGEGSNKSESEVKYLVHQACL